MYVNSARVRFTAATQLKYDLFFFHREFVGVICVFCINKCWNKICSLCLTHPRATEKLVISNMVLDKNYKSFKPVPRKMTISLWKTLASHRCIIQKLSTTSRSESICSLINKLSWEYSVFVHSVFEEGENIKLMFYWDLTKIQVCIQSNFTAVSKKDYFW